MSIIQNNITFSKINTTDTISGYSTKKTRTSFISSNKYDETKIQNSINAVENGNITWDKIAFINAAEIDWNGAELELPEELGGTQYISTTGQLFRRL